MRVLKVRLDLPPWTAPQPGAVVTVTVEDTSRQDAPAVTVTGLTLHLPPLTNSSALPLVFDCPLPDIVPDSLEVSAQLRFHSEARLRAGDLVTVVAAPVRPDSDTVRLQLVPTT